MKFESGSQWIQSICYHVFHFLREWTLLIPKTAWLLFPNVRLKYRIWWNAMCVMATMQRIAYWILKFQNPICNSEMKQANIPIHHLWMLIVTPLECSISWHFQTCSEVRRNICLRMTRRKGNKAFYVATLNSGWFWLSSFSNWLTILF